MVSDPGQRIPEFYHYVHEFSSKCLNADRGRWEAMWASEETNRLSLEDLEAVIDKTVYTLCNPVTSRLVSSGADWPGLRMWWADEPIVVERPDVFFTDESPLPDEITLRFVPPSELAGLDDDAGVARVRGRIAQREDEVRRKMFVLGRSFLGLGAINDQRWSESPATFALRRGLRPRIATKNKWRRQEAIARDRAFVAAYRWCREQWLAGNRDVVWPAGTYQMRVLHGVPCASGDARAQGPPG